MVVMSLASEELAAAGTTAEEAVGQSELRLLAAAPWAGRTRSVAFVSTVATVQLGWLAGLSYLVYRVLG
jgi:hypothetical protein